VVWCGVSKKRVEGSACAGEEIVCALKKNMGKTDGRRR
jgi:hypothetical protein